MRGGRTPQLTLSDTSRASVAAAAAAALDRTAVTLLCTESRSSGHAGVRGLAPPHHHTQTSLSFIQRVHRCPNA